MRMFCQRGFIESRCFCLCRRNSTHVGFEWTVTHPNDAHSAIRQDTNDSFFIAILLIRHFEFCGGLVLPPLSAAIAKEAEHEAVMKREKEAGSGVDNVFIHYPNW